jgi:hypothetical protein
VLLINPGAGEGRHDSADRRHRQLLHAYSSGRIGIASIFAHQREDIQK